MPFLSGSAVHSRSANDSITGALTPSFVAPVVIFCADTNPERLIATNTARNLFTWYLHFAA
jgi:hypothetical protein